MAVTPVTLVHTASATDTMAVAAAPTPPVWSLPLLGRGTPLEGVLPTQPTPCSPSSHIRVRALPCQEGTEWGWTGGRIKSSASPHPFLPPKLHAGS